MNVAVIDLFYANEEWAKLRRPGAVEFVQRRLSALSKSLGDKPYLDDVAGGVRRARAMEQHTAGQKRHPDDTWVHGGGGIPAGNE